MSDSKSCEACYVPSIRWLKLQDYPGMHLCHKHIEMMYNDPKEVGKLVRKKIDALVKRQAKAKRTRDERTKKAP